MPSCAGCAAILRCGVLHGHRDQPLLGVTTMTMSAVITTYGGVGVLALTGTYYLSEPNEPVHFHDDGSRGQRGERVWSTSGRVTGAAAAGFPASISICVFTSPALCWRRVRSFSKAC